MTTTQILANIHAIAPAQQKVVQLLAHQHPNFNTFCQQLKTHVGEKNYQKLVASNV
jgi:hypothetical protein